MGRKLFPVLILVLLVAGRVLADESPWDKLTHTKEIEKHVLIIHDSNVADLQKLTTDPKQWTICDIQSDPEKLTAEQAASIMAWVQQGGSIWYQDSRMADKFGMEAAPITTEEIFKSTSEEAPYNTHQKFKGLAVVAYPMDNGEPVLTDVSAVAAFLVPVGKDQYSAVKADGNVIGLLRAAPNPEADNAYKMVAAYKRVGTGMVVFKPLVWVESLSSDRFQTNLREWVAGYPIPQLGQIGDNDPMNSMSTHGPSMASASATDQVTLDTGTVLEGEVENKVFRCIGGSASTESGVDRTKVQSIEMGGGDDVVHLKSGESMHGLVDFGDEDLTIKLTDGSTRHLRKDEVKRIDFGSTGNVHG